MQPALLHQMFGRYELLALLARGGMAEVFLARMTGVGGFAKLLVIKRILPHLMSDPEFVEMFANEGRIAARLAHPNVCQVYELGEVDADLYLAMEYLEGLAYVDLIPLVPRDGRFELRCAAGVLGQIAEGLAYAHELRDVDGTPTPVIHRDVSPQNLMVTTTGVCKLLDFGVSKVLTEGSRTRTGALKGKLPYMAPEQIRGEPLDARADVFSMGVVLWEALTGKRLFKRESDYLIWRAVTEEPIPTVTSQQPRLPRAIDAVVTRALERERERRYPSIRAFAAELRQVAAQVGGALDAHALAEVLRSVAGGQLAERTELVARASGRTVREPPPKQSLELAVTEPNPIVEASDTQHSIALRSASVKLGRKRRRWPLVAVLALGATGGVVAAMWPEHKTSTPVADAARADAPVVTDAAPADAAVEEEEVAEEPTDAGVAHHKIVRHVTKPAEPGSYSIDSKPYATIYIDGKSYGETPLFKVSVPAGRHRVRAVRADGKAKQLSITIEPGKLLTSGTLTW